MQSGRSQSVVNPIPQRIHSFQAADSRGKHRIQAELKRLEQEAGFLEEELEQIEMMEKASAACKEMLSNVEGRPDPLLPITNGPINPLWDQWFEGPQEAQGCKCWILWQYLKKIRATVIADVYELLCCAEKMTILQKIFRILLIPNSLNCQKLNEKHHCAEKLISSADCTQNEHSLIDHPVIPFSAWCFPGNRLGYPP